MATISLTTCLYHSRISLSEIHMFNLVLFLNVFRVYLASSFFLFEIVFIPNSIKAGSCLEF